jgi:hypothetical protein
MSYNNASHLDTSGLNHVAQAPFTRLPPEILGQIALHGLDMENGPKPSILNQVSAFMRSTINGTKVLWSTVCIVRSIRDGIRVVCAPATNHVSLPSYF